MDYQTEFKVKCLLWQVASNREISVNVTNSTLMSQGYDEAITGPIAELLLADSRVVFSTISIKKANLCEVIFFYHLAFLTRASCDFNTSDFSVRHAHPYAQQSSMGERILILRVP